MVLIESAAERAVAQELARFLERDGYVSTRPGPLALIRSRRGRDAVRRAGLEDQRARFVRRPRRCVRWQPATSEVGSLFERVVVLANGRPAWSSEPWSAEKSRGAAGEARGAMPWRIGPAERHEPAKRGADRKSGWAAIVHPSTDDETRVGRDPARLSARSRPARGPATSRGLPTSTNGNRLSFCH